jgi:hypothetical protein
LSALWHGGTSTLLYQRCSFTITLLLEALDQAPLKSKGTDEIKMFSGGKPLELVNVSDDCPVDSQ